MKYRNLMLCFLLLGIMFLSTGCSNHRELGNLSVITGFFLEKSQDSYLLIADCVNFSEQEQKSVIRTKPITVVASSLSDAFSKLNRQSHTPLYFHRAKVFLLGNNLSEQSAKEIGKELFSGQIVRSDISLLRAEISAEEIGLEPYRGFGLSLDAQLKKEGFSNNSKLYQLIKDPEKFYEIPTVLLSENGFYLQETNPTK